MTAAPRTHDVVTALASALLAAACGRVGYDQVHAGGVPIDGQADAAPAGPPDADTDVGRESPCGVDRAVLFCDDFEQGLPSGPPGAYRLHRERGGVADLSLARAHRGRAALHAGTPAETALAFGWRTVAPPVSSGGLHARAFVYLPRFAVSRFVGLLELRRADDWTGTQKISVDLVQGDALQLSIRTADRTLVGPAAAFPRERWVCLELAIDVSEAPGAGSVEARVDGAPVVRSPLGLDTRPTDGYGDFLFGLVGADAGGEVWMDDVVLDDVPIGCR
jgi:hypothetical protein